MKCAVCHVAITTADADHLISTDAGPVHRECFEGPLPPDGPSAEEIIDVAEEEDARQRCHDVPLPDDFGGHGVAGAAARGMARPDYDRADIDMIRMQREDDENFGRYSEEGRTY